MSGGSEQTQTQETRESVGPWGPSQEGLRGILDQARGLLGNTGLTGNENQAITGMVNNANIAGGYTDQMRQLTDRLFAGGGLGQGMPALQQAWQTAQGALNPIATGNLDPSQNPQMQQMIQQITDRARNSVGSQFAGAGRSFSGAHAGATGKAITEGLAPTLFNQYNQNVQNAMGASGQLMQGAQGYSQGLDNAAGNQLNAQMQAPGSLNNLNGPQMMMLQAEAARRGIPVQNLAQLSGLMVPIASLGREGTSNQTTTQTQENDPWQTAIGGLVGGAGMLGGMGAFGTGGWLNFK
jgi:hypothetical protein